MTWWKAVMAIWIVVSFVAFTAITARDRSQSHAMATGKILGALTGYVAHVWLLHVGGFW